MNLRQSVFFPAAFVAAVTLVGPVSLVPAQETPSNRDSGRLPTSVTQQQVEASFKRLTYKTVGDVNLELHVFYPPDHQAEDSRPAIVFFFGGGWVGGSPSQFYTQAWYLSQRGMVAACAEYRIASKHKTSPRECVKDGKSAMRYLRSNARQMGIDPQRIVASGGSAGGHVAAATATVTKINEDGEDLSVSAVPQALVLFNPVLDNGPDGWGHKKVKEYWRDISPMHNVPENPAPALFMLGDQDKLIPVSVAQRFKDRVEQQGGRCDVLVTHRQGHGYFNRGQSFIDTLKASDRFLVSLGMLSGEPQVEQLLGDLVMGHQQPKKKKKRD